MKVKSESEVAQSCLTHSDPMDCSLPGSSVHGIFQARVLEWGAIAFSLYLDYQYPILSLIISHLNYWESVGHSVMSDSSVPMDCSLPGSSIHGIFQARVLEWVAITFST